MRAVLFHLFVLLNLPCQLPAQQVPAYLMEMGSSGDAYALLVDKKNQRIALYHSSPDGPQLLKYYRCTTGKNNNGSKSREGDLKTPNGIYFFKSVMEDEQLPPEYGVRAFPMDYPNDYDRLLNKSGHGIWLHAVNEDRRVEISYDTKGCVVVTNNDILELSKYITLNKTPIIVDDSILTTTPSELKREREEILRFVNDWADAWQNKELERYMACYHERFRGYGRTKAQHREHKNRLNKAYSWIKVEISDFRIYKYYNYLVVSFDQRYRSPRFRSTGRKKLYLTRTDNGLSIISEKIMRY